MQLIFPPVAEQHPLLPNSVHRVVDNWLAGFCFWAIVNPCIIFVIAQAGRHRRVCILYLFGYHMLLVIILHCLLLKVVDLLCKANLFHYLFCNNLQKLLSC